MARKLQMKVFIFGSKGMLGRYVFKYLKQFYHVTEINRDQLHVTESVRTEVHSVLKKHEFQKGDVVINCIGTIKPRVDDLGTLNCLVTNSLFPHVLSELVKDLGGFLIHPTTDCVYEGTKGGYIETDSHDIKDIYGRSKSLGENNEDTLIRTSIIGEELINKRSLVEWVKSNKGGKINGFTNHYWNGITCLEFAKLCKRIIDDGNFWKGVKHIFSNTVTKYELLQEINQTYELQIKINPILDKKEINRSLSTIFEIEYEITPIKEQILEMKNFQI
jgi:dTDP-4-dehydrorhamnose reductase